MTKRGFISIELFILLATLPSCFQTTQVSSVPLHEAAPGQTGIFYSLPLTTFVIRIEAEQTLFIPGPYAAFAEKYLGIQDAKTQPVEKWQFTGVQIETITEPDPSAWYFLHWNAKHKLPPVYDHLVRQGMILDPVNKTSFSFPGISPEETDIALKPVFPDVSYTDYFAEKTDTLYKTVFQDSVFVNIPVFRKHMQQKNLEEKASEAAHLIHKLRKRRFKMAAADYNIIPQGEAMKAAIEELNRTEELYLSLFVGKTISRKYSKTFLYTPTADQPLEAILARFSPASGWSEEKTVDALPLRIVIMPQERNFPKPPLDTDKKKEANVIYYRLPIPAEVDLFLGPEQIVHIRSSVYQMGNLISIRAN